MLLSIATMIAVGMAVYIITPLLTAETDSGPLPVDVTLHGDLKRRRLVVYDNLKDLEFEFQSGKIAREDYEGLRRNYLGEAAGLMAATQQAELVKEDDALIEREVANRRTTRQTRPDIDYKCPACGYENPVPVKFCGECGAPLASPARKRV